MPNHCIFIASYRKDFEWLIPCLTSIHRFAHGFMAPAVCVDRSEAEEAAELCARFCPSARVVVKNGEGFMRAQIGMMEADLLVPDADVIYLVGSDCMFFADFTPEMYCRDDKPVVLVNTWAFLSAADSPCMPWRRGIERVLGFTAHYEFMRRLPSIYPASIFAPMRAHVEALHGKPFGEYIIEGNKARRDTSEANILGTFAWEKMPQTCFFLDVDNVEWVDGNPKGYPSAMVQFWSHGGMDRPTDACVRLPDGTETHGKTPRAIIDKVLGSI